MSAPLNRSAIPADRPVHDHRQGADGCPTCSRWIALAALAGTVEPVGRIEQFDRRRTHSSSWLVWFIRPDGQVYREHYTSEADAWHAARGAQRRHPSWDIDVVTID